MQEFLDPGHCKLIDGSSISPEVAAARGYRSVTVKAELSGLGFSEKQCRVPALLIPVYSVRGEIATYQIRPDEPRAGKNGKPIKYETVAGSRMVLDVPPGARDHLGDPTVPLFITEGVRKADSAVSRGLCCIDLLGVWNWRGSNEHGGKVALPDWEAIALEGRKTYICFDSDVMEKKEVQAALVRLKKFLEARKAVVSMVYLPAGPGGAKQGLDDFFATGKTVDDLLSHASADLQITEELKEHPYSVEAGRIVFLRRTPDGDVPIQLCNFTAEITHEIVRDDGQDSQSSLVIEGTLADGRVLPPITIPTRIFAGMSWPIEWGVQAVVAAGTCKKDLLREAIQLFSTGAVRKVVYTHTGWRILEVGPAFLHAQGAIGAQGPVPNIEVELPDPLKRFALPAPSTGDDLKAAIRGSLRFLDVAPGRITFPILSACYRTILGSIDFSFHLAGPTGIGKTQIAALAQQHFGPELDAMNLPAGWSSTANALETLAFHAKDSLLVVDDFAPTGASPDVQRMHREADRLLRAQGNNAGRQRLRADASLRPDKRPRGLILSTGEDVPKGQSLRARLLVLELGPEDVDWNRLTICQREAAAGLYASSMAGFIQWVARQYEKLRRRLKVDFEDLRARATGSGCHKRTPGIIANLANGLRYFLEFAVECGAITRQESEALDARGWKALGEAAAAQVQHQEAAEPTARYLELLDAALASGDAHVAGPNGGAPENPKAWGWRSTSESDDLPGFDWKPLGKRIGWLESGNLYLEPDSAFAVAQEFARKQGDSISVGMKTLHKRLHEKGFLASTDITRKTLTLRRILEDTRRSVLHLRVSSSGGLGTILRADPATYSARADELVPKAQEETAQLVSAGQLEIGVVQKRPFEGNSSGKLSSSSRGRSGSMRVKGPWDRIRRPCGIE